MQRAIVDCLLCNAPLQQQFGWQQFFIRQLPQTICMRCEQQFERLTEQREQDVQSLFMYNRAMKDYIHRYKFLCDVQLAKVFNQALHEQLKNEEAIIVPIPMHSENLIKRTFAPVDELLRAAEIPFVHLLKKTTTETQVGKTKKERLAVSQLFETLDVATVRELNILLFDDLYTTGTTIKHATNALLRAGAKNVKAITLIHG